VERFRGGLVFKAHRLMYHSTLGSRVITKKKEGVVWRDRTWSADRRSTKGSSPCCTPRTLLLKASLLRSFGFNVEDSGLRVYEGLSPYCTPRTLLSKASLLGFNVEDLGFRVKGLLIAHTKTSPSVPVVHTPEYFDQKLLPAMQGRTVRPCDNPRVRLPPF